MCTRNLKFANTGLVNISTANSALNGTGALGMVMQSPGGGNGTIINAITIKATGNTTEGMVRLFVYDLLNYYLWKEVSIPENTQTGVVEAFQVTVNETLTLNPNEQLMASTENNESFNIYANGVDWKNCECGEDPTCGEETIVANTGMVNIATGNSALNGTGAMGIVVTAIAAGPTIYGTRIPLVNVKATQTTTQGMLRLFIDNGGTKFLVWEIPIPGCTQTGVQPAYRTQCLAVIDLQAGYKLLASTENSESFNVIAFTSDVTNCPC